MVGFIIYSVFSAHAHTHTHTHMFILQFEKFEIWWFFADCFDGFFDFSSCISPGLFFCFPGNFQLWCDFLKCVEEFFLCFKCQLSSIWSLGFTPTTFAVCLNFGVLSKSSFIPFFADFGIQLWGWDVGTRPNFYLVLLQMGELSKDWSIRYNLKVVVSLFVNCQVSPNQGCAIAFSSLRNMKSYVSPQRFFFQRISSPCNWYKILESTSFTCFWSGDGKHKTPYLWFLIVYIFTEKKKKWSSRCSCGCVLCVSLLVEGNKIFHLGFRFIEAMINKNLLILKNHFAIQINILVSQVLRQISWMHPSLWVVDVWEVSATWICTSWLIDSPNGHHPQHSSFHLPKTSKEHKSCCWLRDPTSTTTMDLCMQRKFLQLPQGWTQTCEFKHSNFYQTTWTTQ